MLSGKQSILWPASPDDPDASTLLTVADLIEAGGADGLRTYVTGRLLAISADEPAAPSMWAAFAVLHLRERAGDAVDGGLKVSAASVQMVLAYIAYLEAALAAERAA